MANIHVTAIVDAGAQLDDSVSVGPYSIIGPHVKIASGTQIGAHCTIEGKTSIGRDNKIFQFSSLGAIPQDKKYNNEETALEIGDNNTIREFCSLNLGTIQDEGVTRIGNDNWIMAYVHVAHDCLIGNHTIIANATQLGGHVHIADWVFLGGLCGVHQFVRIGAHAMTGFQTRLSQDLPPFVMAVGSPAEAQGVNQEGLLRRGFSGERIATIKQMHRLIYRRGLTLAAAQEEIKALVESAPHAAEDISLMLGFVASAERGIVR
jgi:UDP-N-acetylglucosamine acyltransferase